LNTESARFRLDLRLCSMAYRFWNSRIFAPVCAGPAMQHDALSLRIFRRDDRRDQPAFAVPHEAQAIAIDLGTAAEPGRDRLDVIGESRGSWRSPRSPPEPPKATVVHAEHGNARAAQRIRDLPEGPEPLHQPDLLVAIL
jgi:hypothetical protein